MAEDDSLSDDDSDNVDDGDDDDDSYDSDDSFYANLPSARQKKAAKSKAKTEKKDAKSSIMVKKNESHEKFTIAKNIKNLDDLLYGPPMLHMAAADYLQVVGDDTNTECSLNGRVKDFMRDVRGNQVTNSPFSIANQHFWSYRCSCQRRLGTFPNHSKSLRKCY